MSDRVRLKKPNMTVPTGVCEKLKFSDVPKPPRRVANGVVDQDAQRWRFKASKLVVYILYSRDATKHPWSALWVPEYG